MLIKIGSRGWALGLAGVVVMAAIALSGCGQSEENAAKSQVIARLGGEDVTVAELDHEFQALKVPAEKRDDATTRQVVGSIVARKYLAQQAVATHVDREPAVHLELMRSREEMLASIFAQRDLSMKLDTVSNSEIAAFMEANPDQYKNRKIYAIEEVSFVPPLDIHAMIKEMGDVTSLDQVSAELKRRGVKATESTGSLDSGTLNETVLERIRARTATNVFFLEGPNSASFFVVTGETLSPYTPEAAMKRARSQLAYRLAMSSQSSIYDAAIKETKFVGDYVRLMKIGATTTPSPAPTPFSPSSSSLTPSSDKTATPGPATAAKAP